MAKKQVQEAAPVVPANKNLYIAVNTFSGANGRPEGYRCVDLFHFGTRNWLQSHLWWAMHNGHSVEVAPASDEQIAEYLAEAKQALADKFNKEPAQAAA